MSEIIPTTKCLYELQYCPDKDEYYDHPPVKKSERNTIAYFCACKCNSNFVSYSDWMRHINLKVHKDYKANYKFLHKPLLDARAMIIDLKRECHKQENKYKGLKIQHKLLTNKMKDQQELENMMKKLEVDNQALMQKMADIEDYVMSDSDEEFTDCA